ncbi:MAG: DUF732 domain-containing protein [Mycobacterium sp.]|uniref:DUF732 domain-containing protein n=1 Tax=Mycobacterium sp. TaxID=1785 RepID=UPI003F9B230B
MTHIKLGFGKWSTVCAVLLSAAALVSAAPASADQTDDAFVAALAKGGITMSDPDAAIATAHTVCAGLDTNQDASALAMKLMQDADLSPKETGYFIGLSVAAYCPQYKGKVRVSFAWLLPGDPAFM